MKEFKIENLIDLLTSLSDCPLTKVDASVGINIGGDIVSIESVAIDPDGLVYINANISQLTMYERKVEGE